MIFNLNLINVSDLLAGFVHIFIGLYLFKKHKFNRHTIQFISFYIVIGLTLFFIFLYDAINPITNIQMKFLYSFVYTLSFFDIFSLMVGAEYLIRKIEGNHLIYSIFLILGLLLLFLQQTEVTHVIETRRPIFTVPYGMLLMIYLAIPPLYLLYLLYTIKIQRFSRKNQQTIKRLRIAFLIYLIYPFSNSLSNSFSTLSNLANLEFVFLLSSVIIFLSLPNVNGWIIDIIKMKIESNFSQFETLPNDIDKTWQKFAKWERNIKYTHTNLNVTDIKSYLKQIEEMKLDE